MNNPMRTDGPLFDSVDGLLRELVAEPETVPSQPEEPSLPAGTRIGRFELLCEIGRGGFGIVYEALDTSLGRRVAFKLVRGGRRMEMRREGLLREAEAAARLSHPNVVTLFDLGTSEHGPYLVLELLRGETLATRTLRELVQPAEAAAVGVEIARGLTHAHAAGIVHGDVTPGNVFLCEGGGVKLLDLGLAHVFGSSQSAGGTRGYLAPELRSGAPPSARTDLFALGVVLFRMVTGALPYRSDDEVQRPRLDLPAAPALADVIEHLIAPDPADRPASAASALAELEACRLELEREADPVRRPGRRAGVALALGAFVVAVVVGAIALRGGRGGGAGGPASSGVATLAVLPFVDRTPDHSQPHLAEGVADHLRVALGDAGGLRLIGRASSVALEPGISPDVAAQRLGASNLLLGSTRRDAGKFEVAAELRDAAGGVLWSHTYTGAVTDVFSFQQDIVARTRSALAVTPAAARPLERRPGTSNPEAYTALLDGRHHYFRVTPDGFRLAARSFERALELDPSYGEAWSNLAEALLGQLEMSGTPNEPQLRALRERAVFAADKAVQIAPDLPDALSTRGYVLAFIAHDWTAAMADFGRALDIEPDNTDTLRRYGMLLEVLGRFDEAVAAARKALAHDPLNASSWALLAQVYADAGNLDEAERAARRIAAVSPETPIGPIELGYVMLLRSKPDEALASFARCPEPYGPAGTAMAEHSLGHADKAAAALAGLERRHGHDSAYFIAQVYAWKGDADRAFSWLERAFANNEQALPFVTGDRIFAGLRGDPRFTALLRRLGIKT